MLVGIPYRQSAGHKLVMQSLKTQFLVIRDLIDRARVILYLADCQEVPVGQRAHVDLVKGQPVLDLVLIALKNGFAIGQIAVDDLSPNPAVILFH